MHPSAANRPTVLVAPLDWGLGHATRCIPIVRELLRQNCTVLLAAEGRVKALLQAEFPALRMLHLPGYHVQYARSKMGLAVKIVAQIPSILSSIQFEQAWLKKVVVSEQIDAVISDNRYGLHHPAIRSVLVTHQLRIRAPFAEGYLQKLNYRFIDHFDECWVPDAAGEENLAGELSHPRRLPTVPVRYTGALSRFTKSPQENGGEHLLVLLSGPEPQRTLLEKILLAELKSYTKPVVLVRGLPAEKECLLPAENITVFNHLPAAQLQEKLCRASLVIARCGYSTVMDLAALKKRSVLIPTPGQTEQEYLAKHLQKNRFALCVPQNKFRLKPALELAEHFAYRFPEGTPALAAVVNDFLQTLGTRRPV